MALIMMMNGVIFCLVFMWTSAATEPKSYDSGNGSHLDIQLRGRTCRNLGAGGQCVKKRKECPKDLTSETKPGKPYCSRKRRCCYTEEFNLISSSHCPFICDDRPPVNISNCEDIEFRLYNSIKEHYDILITNNTSSVDSSSFNSSLPLLVVAHGYEENATTSHWMHEIKNKSLEKIPMNVILVQWAKYADTNKFLYCEAVKSTKCVGTRLTHLLYFLKNYTGLSPSDTHIIGFSLGAQLAGVAGHQVQNLSRITGLDPAGPGFYDVDLSDRLDQEDATFVDIIHTNGGCIETGHCGFIHRCGHVEFFMNGGSSQNGCPLHSWKCVEHPEKCFDSLACSHDRAHAYYVESLTAVEPSYGYQCENYTNFKYGLCLNNTHNTVGYGVTPDNPGLFYSNTQARSTFLTRSILLQLTVGGDDKTFHGKAFVGAILPNPNRTEETVDIMRNYTGVQSGVKLKTLITVPSGTMLDTIQISAKYKYDRLFFWDPHHLVASNIEAYDAYARSWFCVSGPTVLEDRKVKKFTPTPGRCTSSE